MFTCTPDPSKLWKYGPPPQIWQKKPVVVGHSGKSGGTTEFITSLFNPRFTPLFLLRFDYERKGNIWCDFIMLKVTFQPMRRSLVSQMVVAGVNISQLLYLLTTTLLLTGLFLGCGSGLCTLICYFMF